MSTASVRAAIAQCLATGTPVVVSAERPGLGDGVIALDLDHRQGARLARAALREAGRTRTALVLGDARGAIGRRIAEGADAEHVVDAAYSFDGAVDAARSLPSQIDSIIVATLPMALGVCAVLARQGRDVPVIVCEEVPLAAQVRPSLTTSAVPPELTGEEMVRLIARQRAGQPIEPRPLVPMLIRRESF